MQSIGDPRRFCRIRKVVLFMAFLELLMVLLLIPLEVLLLFLLQMVLLDLLLILFLLTVEVMQTLLIWGSHLLLYGCLLLQFRELLGLLALGMVFKMIEQLRC